MMSTSKDLLSLGECQPLCLSPSLSELPRQGHLQVAEVAGALDCRVAQLALQTASAECKDKHTHCRENTTWANLNPDAFNSVKTGVSRLRIIHFLTFDACTTVAASLFSHTPCTARCPKRLCLNISKGSTRPRRSCLCCTNAAWIQMQGSNQRPRGSIYLHLAVDGQSSMQVGQPPLMQLRRGFLGGRSRAFVCHTGAACHRTRPRSAPWKPAPLPAEQARRRSALAADRPIATPRQLPAIQAAIDFRSQT